MTVTATTETETRTNTDGSETILIDRKTAVYSDGTTRLGWTAYTEYRDQRLAYGRGHELTEKDCKAIDRALRRYRADQAIRPAAEAAALDHGRSFDATDHARSRLLPVDFSKVQVGDLVWVYSFQVWRRGVVEAIGRTNLKVAVVVASTGTFSRQSVKAGEVWWDSLNV